MAGIALKGQCDLVSIMVPPKVSIKENVSIDGTKNLEDDEVLLICTFMNLNIQCGNRV